MSRWIDQFETHAFQSEWIKLKQALDEATFDDKTITTSVTELARLKKVVSYIDGMIKSIDPELVPLPTWDQFNQQLVQCLNQIVNYNDNKNIKHIQSANTNADNLLTYIRPYMVAVEKVDAVFQSAIKKYAKTIDEYGDRFSENSIALIEEISGYNDSSKILYDNVQNTKSLIDQFNVELFGVEEADTSIKNKIEALVGELESKRTSIEEFYNETLIGVENNPSTKRLVSDAKEDILTEKTNIEALLEDVESKVIKLNQFHEKMFGKFNDDEQDGGLSGELDERIKVLGDFETKQETKYKALNEQIESLMPGATSAGLASAYLEMKKSFDEPIKSASNLFFFSIFLIVVIAVFSTLITIGSEAPYVTFRELNEWDKVLKGFVSRIPLYAPILWLAIYASKRRSECQRLQQEYAHKEALAKSYDKYKKQIDDLGQENIEMQKTLIMKAVDAIAYNASDTLDGKHGDKMPIHDFFEKNSDLIKKIVEEVSTKLKDSK